MMPKACIVGLLVSLMCTIGQAQVVMNGSFEEGAETTGVVSGSDTVTGWAHNGGQNVLMYHVYHDVASALFPKAASDTGSYYAGISAGYIKNSYLYLYQTLGPMDIGQTYKITGYVNNISGSAGAYGYWKVQVGNTVLGTGELNGTWQYFSFFYTANPADGFNPTLYLGYVDNESAGGTTSGVLYDAVTMEPIVPGASYLENGSFEEGVETDGSWGAATDDAVDGWHHNAGNNCMMYHINSGVVDAFFPQAKFPASSPEVGNYYAGITARYVKNAYLYLSRTLNPLELGQKYKISGYVNNGGTPYGYWQVQVGNTVLGTGRFNRSWQYFSFTYTANSTDGLTPTLYLGYVDNESASGIQSSVLYDSVTVTRVPPAAPVFSPGEMYISGPTAITITSELPGAKIYYTLDGQTPTPESPLYTGPVTVYGGTTLKAIAVADGLEPSAVNAMTFRTPTIPIVAWRGLMSKATSRERFQEFKEAGFTHQIQYPNIHFYTYSTFAEVERALELAKEIGIKLFLTPIEPVEEFVAQFKDHPALEGYFITDEPSPEAFSALAAQVQYMQSLDADHWCYINLYANYAAPGGSENYGAYVNNFLSTIPTTVLSFDHYPIIGETTARPEFYENLEVISGAAREAGKPFWAFALATAHESYPVPTLAHLRYQVYSNLAYGAQGIQYYTYWTPFEESYHSGPLTKYGERTDTYYLLQTLNEEVRNLSHVFLDSQVVRVGHTGGSIPAGTTPYTAAAPIQSLTTTGSDGAVVSEIVDGEDNYVVVVNRDLVNTMTLSVSVDTAMYWSRVGKDGMDTPLGGSTVQYTVAPADIVVLRWRTTPAPTPTPGPTPTPTPTPGPTLTPTPGPTPTPIPGDANRDRRVTFEDFAILQNHYGQSVTGDTWTQGDFNGDGQVTFQDFAILQNHYGQGSGMGTAAAAEALNADAGVPCGSPGLILLPLIGLGVLSLRRQN